MIDVLYGRYFKWFLFNNFYVKQKRSIQLRRHDSFTACEPRILIQWDDDWEGFTTLIEITPETADARQIENIIKEL